MGAALATFGRRAVLHERVAARWRWVLDGFAALVVFALFLTLANVKESGSLYLIGFPVVGVLTVVLIALATQPVLGIGRILTLAPLRWIGERSYGMYLWHWPIFQATRPDVDLALGIGPDLVLRLSLTALVAEISYRYVEMPIRRGSLGRAAAHVRAWRPAKLRWAAGSAAIALAALASMEAMLANRAVSAYAASLQPLTLPVAGDVKHGKRNIAFARTGARAVMAHPAAHEPAMLVGDSVMLGVKNFIARQVNVVDVNAEVGRQAITTLAVIRSLALHGNLQPTVIVDLGNNGTVEEATLRGILSTLKHCKYVVIVNARVPRPWQDNNDALMARIVPTYPNAALADWYGASAHRPDYFAADGVHPTVSGAQAYAHAIVAALDETARKHARVAVKQMP